MQNFTLKEVKKGQKGEKVARRAFWSLGVIRQVFIESWARTRGVSHAETGHKIVGDE
jgi:hypothetical protein